MQQVAHRERTTREESSLACETLARQMMHVPRLRGRCKRSESLPTRLFGSVLLWEEHDDVVRLGPGAEAGMRDKGVVEAVAKVIPGVKKLF